MLLGAIFLRTQSLWASSAFPRPHAFAILRPRFNWFLCFEISLRDSSNPRKGTNGIKNKDHVCTSKVPFHTDEMRCSVVPQCQEGPPLWLFQFPDLFPAECQLRNLRLRMLKVRPFWKSATFMHLHRCFGPRVARCPLAYQDPRHPLALQPT